jgi:hypothetical protein
MWGIDPKKLCRKHLLGEHVEMHMFAGTIKKGISISGYLSRGLVNPREIQSRHDLLSEEMQKRGYNHQSPLSIDCSVLPYIPVNITYNELELKRRCQECRI